MLSSSEPPIASKHPNPSHVPRTQQHASNAAHVHSHKTKKKPEPHVDPATMYESLKNRIAALEEEEEHADEEERQFAEEARKSVRNMEGNAINAKYIELFAEMKRIDRDHAKEKQKLIKDKDSAKSQVTKANQARAKMENLARELQKDNKKLREDSKRLLQSVAEAKEEVISLKKERSKHNGKAKVQEIRFRDMSDIVVRVVCKYRSELFFKVPRKAKLLRLFNAWIDRMDGATHASLDSSSQQQSTPLSAQTDDQRAEGTSNAQSIQYIFTYNGRIMESDQTLEEAGLEDGDEILAVEMIDLAHYTGTSDTAFEPQQSFLKSRPNNPGEAKEAVEQIFNGIVQARLKDLLRQYELRERHVECVIRSKELEILLSKARAAEQKQLADDEKAKADSLSEENETLRKDVEQAQAGQAKLIEKLISCCKEPNAERTQRLFASLRDELEKRGTKM